jgi:hypothetical protein
MVVVCVGLLFEPPLLEDPPPEDPPLPDPLDELLPLDGVDGFDGPIGEEY